MEESQESPPGTTANTSDSTAQPPQVSKDEIHVVDEAAVVSKSHKRLFILGGIVLLIVVAVATGVMFIPQVTKSLQEEKPSPPSQEEIETAPEEQVEPIRKKLDITLEVVNGSGIRGQAASGAEKLAALGYTIVKTGNADEQSYTKSQVLISEKLDAEATKILLDDLKELFTIASASGELEDSTASARIILGKNVSPDE